MDELHRVSVPNGGQIQTYTLTVYIAKTNSKLESLLPYFVKNKQKTTTAFTEQCH